jgi:hypothetical protein
MTLTDLPALNRPAHQPCARTYAQIVAHCSIRHGASTGAALRELAGAHGDIMALPTAAITSRFAGIRLAAAMHNMWIAEYSKIRRRRNHGQETS